MLPHSNYVGILQNQMGNMFSVAHAMEAVGGNVKICETAHDLDSCSRLILPGVGSYFKCMQNLKALGFYDALQVAVIEKRKPFMGICLGMQALASFGDEGGQALGLNWISGSIEKIENHQRKIQVPHLGWNEIEFQENNVLFQGIPKNAEFYFVHSYWLHAEDSKNVAAWFEHGSRYSAAVAHQNIFGVQFHPEKSQTHGLRILKNFLAWNGR